MFAEQQSLEPHWVHLYHQACGHTFALRRDQLARWPLPTYECPCCGEREQLPDLHTEGEPHVG